MTCKAVVPRVLALITSEMLSIVGERERIHWSVVLREEYIYIFFLVDAKTSTKDYIQIIRTNSKMIHTIQQQQRSKNMQLSSEKLEKEKNIVKFHTYITVRIRFSMVFARPYVRRPSEAVRGDIWIAGRMVT